MDERASRRFVVDLLTAADIGGVRVPLVLYDLSANGCMVEIRTGLRPAVGSRTVLSLPTGIETSGEIVWRQDFFAGIKFLEPLPEVLVRHLGYRRKADDEEVPLADQFGRPLHPLASYVDL